jgi:hypothetical protein
MDAANIKKFLRGFWMAYALFMMGFGFFYLFNPRGGVSALIVIALGCAVLWAASRSPHKKRADLALQGFFILIIFECIGACMLGDVLYPTEEGAMFIIGVVSLVVWRKKLPSAAKKE